VHLFNPKTGLVVVLAIGVFAGCRGATNYVPVASAPNSVRAIAPNVQSLLSDTTIAAACTNGTAKVPGTYILMVAFGNVKSSKFTSQTGSLWLQERYVKATPGPTPKPSTVPSAKPGPPDYIYTGTYALKNSKQTGCAVLMTTENGKPFAGTTQNAFAVGAPVVKAKAYNLVSTGVTGNLVLTIASLSASGGRGSAKLTTMTGTLYDTATITLTARFATKT